MGITKKEKARLGDKGEMTAEAEEALVCPEEEAEVDVGVVDVGVVEDLEDSKVVDGQTMEEEETEEKESKLENGKETRLPSVSVVERQDTSPNSARRKKRGGPAIHVVREDTYNSNARTRRENRLNKRRRRKRTQKQESGMKTRFERTRWMKEGGR